LAGAPVEAGLPRRVRPALAAGLPLLAAAAFAMNVGMGMQNAAYTNFAVQDLHITAAQLGVVEAMRESSGLLCFLVAALAARLALPRVAGVALVVMGCGMAALGQVQGIEGLIVANFVWGIGFHAYSPISPTLALQMSDDHGRRAGLLGRVSAVGALATPVGTLLVLALLPWLHLRGQFLPAGLLALAGGVLMFLMPNPRPGPRPRLVLRRAYLPFYVLTFMDGARKQILITFAVFALVSVFHAPVVTVSLLLLGSSLLTMFASAWIGRWIARFGERAVLAVTGAVLVPLFAGYGLATTLPVMMTLYILDNTLFTSNVALQTWVSRKAPADDVGPTLAVGTTVNHISSVIVPLLAGLLWAVYGYRDIFLGGAGIVLCMLVLTLVLLPKAD